MRIMESFRYIFGILCILCSTDVVSNTKIKIIDEPFSLNHAGINVQNIAPLDKEIVSKVKPQKISGPPHLFTLSGKCFILQKSSYKYEFCPFKNVTQRELSYRWNSFQGVLGIWREWNIINNTFHSMFMTDGESCIGHGYRQVMVLFKCGDENKVIDIDEPKTCRYNLTFQTPLACPLDAFMVYPTLTDLGKEQWTEIEHRYHEKELTLKGYQKKRTDLFIREGLKHNEADEEQPKVSSDGQVEAAKTEKTDELNDYRIFGRHECIQKYGELLKEVKQLRAKLKEMGAKSGPTRLHNLTESVGKKEYNNAVNLTRPTDDNTVTADIEVGKVDSDSKMKAASVRREARKGDDGSDNMNHPRSLKRYGRRGDDGTIGERKMGENLISKNGEKFLHSLETARKKVKLTEKEQEQRDKEIAQQHAVNHRVH